MPPALTVYYGSTKYVVSPERTTIIGRSPDCDLVIRNPYVSHHHARITWTEDGWLLADMGSANGLTIQGMHTNSVLLTSTVTVALARDAVITCVVGDQAPQSRPLPAHAPATPTRPNTSVQENMPSGARPTAAQSDAQPQSSRQRQQQRPVASPAIPQQTTEAAAQRQPGGTRRPSETAHAIPAVPARPAPATGTTIATPQAPAIPVKPTAPSAQNPNPLPPRATAPTNPPVAPALPHQTVTTPTEPGNGVTVLSDAHRPTSVKPTSAPDVPVSPIAARPTTTHVTGTAPANQPQSQPNQSTQPTRPVSPAPKSATATVLAGSTQAAHLESQLTSHRVTGSFDPTKDKEGTLGRDESCQIRINDFLVSRRHCSLASTPNGILLTDLDSANGTYVNGRRVAKIWLEEGDLVTVGNTDLIVHEGVLCDREPLTSTDAVIAENVGLTVGKGTRLLKGINAVFAKGTLTAVIGPSGAGKTTFTSIVAGLSSPTEGHVLFDGYDVQQNIELLRSRIGFVPQDDVVHRKLTVDAALEYAAKLRLPGSTKAERAEIINHVLEELELTGRRGNRVDQLSGGQRKRVSTAIELLTSPELLILDEPTSGLDPALDLTVMTMLRQLADAGRVVIVVTHSLAYINKLCDNVLMLAPGGKPAFFGSVAEMQQAFHGQEWADIFNAVTANPDRVYSITDSRQRAMAAKQTVRPHGDHEKPAKPFRIKQTVTLVARQLHLIAADPGLLIFLVLLPLFLGLLSLVVPGSHGLGEPDFKDAATEPNQLLSLIILGACFMGSALSVRDIVSERAIYDRERAVGLSPTSYTCSKLIVMGLQTLLQAALLVTAVSLGKPHPDQGVLTDSGIPELVLVVWLTAWASAMLGEVGSALVKSGEQTMPLLVILVMAQLVFSGGMIPVTGRDGLDQLSMVFPGRWGFSAAASDIDLNGLLYGPTKVPTFKKDDLWEHTADQFWFDLGILVLMVVVFTVVLRVCVSNAAAKMRRR
ncbi:FHA domain-containing protein [Bifidobacterium sp. SO4]|uniref:FHA domain-containing protein n=1 Tax=Bifidobacterium sp. SO4 TaxID=2809030 RepID=UPI001BDCEB7D|nr:FHA domain-containing protein [Bifidobacterium sp. SO4]MBT1169783.1 FHA domain-containing protein [Bifidobacterium sp. SO4]